MAELVEPEVLRLRAEGHATLVRLVSDPVEAYHRLRRRALQVIPEWAPQALQREALESIAVGALDEWADPPLVARVVAAVMEEHRT